MQKAKRLLAIEKIIREENISSQELLLRRLRSKGIDCTQATLSRNLRQLGAGRKPDGRGGYKYFLPESPFNPAITTDRLQVLPVITSLIEAKGMMIIRTIPGNASNTAICIDNTPRFEIAGTIAGDDTVLVIPRDGITNQQMHACLEVIIPGLHEHLKTK
jgi:transcriptional regulator of arginine metabolism